MNTIGIRAENKSRWEGRTPVVPEHMRKLIEEHNLRFCVQRSSIRAFEESLFEAVGAKIVDDLEDCPVIMGVKEIPVELLQKGKTYVYFSHTIKGQPANMPALRRLMELGCQLIDYERIVNEKDQRLVFFGPYAGLAGMIDTLWAYGQRLDHEGVNTPFSQIRPAHGYTELSCAKEEIARIGREIATKGLPSQVVPFVCGFAGYGQVSQGAQEVFDVLPVEVVTPEELSSKPVSGKVCYKVVFEEKHLVKPVDPSWAFDKQDYFDNPDRYEADFSRYVEHLSVLVNCIYWDKRYPKLIDEIEFRRLYASDELPKLRVVGDITCDLDGSLACTIRSTTPDAPLYVYDPDNRETINGVVGWGPVVLAVDFLPCELPKDASRFFSNALQPFVPTLAKADFSKSLDESGLPEEIKRAMIVYNGRLTPDYESLSKFI